MRSWSSRNDTFVSDEPLYAYYLKKTKKKHPMYQEIINQYSNDYDQITQYLTGLIPENKKIWYQKHMAHHLIELKQIDWIQQLENYILVRNPKEVIKSYTDKKKLKSAEELGYPQQVEIAKFLKKSNKAFRVIDSEDLLKNPTNVLSNWCKDINIPYQKSMLKWDKGAHKNDGIWWEHWYNNVVKTTGFQKYEKNDLTIDSQYNSIYDESMNYYNFLKSLK